MIFGVSNDERVIGLQNVQDTSEKISEIIKTKMDPIPQVVLDNHTEDGKDFIILRVLPGQETPYYYAADGNHIAYVRVGNESVPADESPLRHSRLFCTRWYGICQKQFQKTLEEDWNRKSGNAGWIHCAEPRY